MARTWERNEMVVPAVPANGRASTVMYEVSQLRELWVLGALWDAFSSPTGKHFPGFSHVANEALFEMRANPRSRIVTAMVSEDVQVEMRIPSHL